MGTEKVSFQRTYFLLGFSASGDVPGDAIFFQYTINIYVALGTAMFQNIYNLFLKAQLYP